MRHIAVGGQNGNTLCGLGTAFDNWTTEGACDFVRLVFVQDHGPTDGSFRIGNVLIAGSAASVLNPVDENGDAVAFTQVTFNNRGAARTLDAELPELSDITRPVPVTLFDVPTIVGIATNSRSDVAHLIYSDWVPVRSIRRTDGRPGRIVHVRTLVPGGY